MRARQAALFGDSPRGKFFFFFGAYCLEPINCGICFFFCEAGDLLFLLVRTFNSSRGIVKVVFFVFFLFAQNGR